MFGGASPIPFVFLLYFLLLYSLPSDLYLSASQAADYTHKMETELQTFRLRKSKENEELIKRFYFFFLFYFFVVVLNIYPTNSGTRGAYSVANQHDHLMGPIDMGHLCLFYPVMLARMIIIATWGTCDLGPSYVGNV